MKRIGAVDASSLDELTKFMASMPGNNQKARNSAMGSIGFRLKGAAKDAVATNKFNWPGTRVLTAMSTKFPADRDETRRTPYRKIIAKQGTIKVPAKAWGALAPLLVYTLDKDSGDLLFGFQAGTFGQKYSHTRSDGTRVRRANTIGQTAVELARCLTEGYFRLPGGRKTHTVTIATTAHQRYFAALGFIFPIGSTLTMPERPLVGPTYQLVRAEIPELFREKFWASLRRSTLGSLERERIDLFKVAA